MFIRIYRIFFGYLRVLFYGDYREKIISLCAHNGIHVWNSKSVKNGIESCISVRDFKLMRKIPELRHARLHILKKRGWPFVVNRYKYRYGLLAGVIVFFLIIELMSTKIWIIDINGNKTVTDSQILTACQNIGIVTGIKTNSIYPKLERERLLLQLDKIAWASLNIEGSRLFVNVTEITEKTDSNKSYSNLKADFDGVIQKLDIVSGTSVVKVGDAVKKGDLLVSGIVESVDETKFVHAKGTVTAKTEHYITLEEAYQQKVSIPNGKVTKKCVVEFFGIKIPLYLGRETGSFNSQKQSETVKLFSQNLPIKIHKKTFVFEKEQKITYSQDTLCKRLDKALLDKQNLIDCEISQVVNKKFHKSGKGIMLTAVIEAVENIAEEDILLINAGNYKENVVE